MSAERKIIAIAALFSFVSCFLPWYGSNTRAAINQVLWNGFDNIGAVAGYLISAFSLATLLLVVFPLIDEKWDIAKKLPWKEGNVLFFLNAQSSFVAMIFIPVYSQYALSQFANSGSRFGLYMTLVSCGVAALASFVLLQREKREEDRSSIVHAKRLHRSLEDLEDVETSSLADDEVVEQDGVVHAHDSSYWGHQAEEEDTKRTSPYL